MKHIISREYLVRKVETWMVDMPDDMDPAHLIEEHSGEFDTDLTSGGSPLYGWTSEQVATTEEHIDYNELTLKVMAREPATILPFARRQP